MKYKRKRDFINIWKIQPSQGLHVPLDHRLDWSKSFFQPSTQASSGFTMVLPKPVKGLIGLKQAPTQPGFTAIPSLLVKGFLGPNKSVHY